MNVQAMTRSDDFERLRPLITEWSNISGGFGMIVNVDTVIQTVQRMATGSASTVLSLTDGEMPHGIIGIHRVKSHIGPDIIAHECLYFVAENHRRHARKLLMAAEQWAKSNGCTHFIITASKLANPRADRVERYYQACGYSPYEATFAKEIC